MPPFSLAGGDGGDDPAVFWALFLAGLTGLAAFAYLHFQPILAVWAERVTRKPVRMRLPPKKR